MSIVVGTGSWADDEYVGVIYPPGTPAAKRLSAYADVFNHVEVNSSYYSTPRREVVAKWVQQTPADFSFTIKLHRAFSQSPEKTARESPLMGYLLKAVQPLIRAKKLGGFLLVLPPTFSPERRRLEELDTLVKKLKPHPLAVELRHRDWVLGKRRAETLAYFRDRGITWVVVDMPRVKGSDIMPAVDEVTRPDLAYIRLHGRNKGWLEAESAAERHLYLYSERELRELAQRVRKLAAKAERVQVVANNHARDFAPRTAVALRELLTKPRAQRSLRKK